MDKSISPLALVLFALCAMSPQSLGQTAGDLVWTYSTGGIVFSSPTVDASGSIYVGSQDGKVYALETVNDQAVLKWSFQTGDWVDSSGAISQDGVLYIASWDDKLYALNAETGVKIWEYSSESLIVASPAIGEDGTIYFGSSDTYFYAINPDGSLKWRYFTDTDVDSSAAIGEDGTLYFGGYDGKLYALSPAGELQWTYQAPEIGNFSNSILSSPAIGADGTIYFASVNGFLYAINPDGTLNWEFETGSEINSSPVVASNGDIYIASRDGFLYSIDEFGIENWSTEIGDVFFGSPIISSEGHLTIASDVGSQTTQIYTLDINVEADDANFLLWEYTINDYVDSSPTLTEDGRIVLGAHDNKVYMFEAGAATLPESGGWPKFRLNQQNTGNVLNTESIQGFEAGMAFFGVEAAYAETWIEVGQMGYLDVGNFPWIYHFGMGWLYASEATQVNSYWFFDTEFGWLWANAAYFPYLWSVESNTWLYFALSGDGAQRWFYDMTNAAWLDQPGSS